MKNKLSIGIIGLGYVGLPLFLEFSKKFKVKGFDLSKKKIELLKKKIDYTNQYTNKDLKKISNKDIDHKSNILKDCNFFIVTVPTPVTKNKLPDLSAVVSATKIICKYLKKNDYVIYESTFYPGVTEDVCVKTIERETKLIGINEKNEKKNFDGFYYGYSPERINPGDLKHGIKDVIKITSGSTNSSAKFIDSIYKKICLAGTHKVDSIKIAESAKVIENTQRDINIALINEFAQIFSKMSINIYDVLRAAKTKWNFLDFRPGLVGGHCIGVDPYYLVYKSETLGYSPKVISSGRQVNDSMGEFVAKKSIRLLNINNYVIKESKVIIMGATYKENSPDTRNTKIPDIYNYLIKNGINTSVYDPIADKESFEKKYGIELISEIDRYDLIILAVPHSLFKEIDLNTIKKDDSSILFDLKGFYPKNLSNARL